MQKQRIKAICMTAMMTALSIIIERLIVPTFQGQPFRFDLGNIPIVLCGVFCGPVYGALCGGISDILGCYFNGYAPFLPLTLSPVLVGAIPAVIDRKCGRFFGHRKNIALYISLVATYVAAEIFWTPFGLSLMKGTRYGVEFAINFPAACIQTVVDIVLIYVILKSRIIERTGLVSK